MMTYTSTRRMQRQRPAIVGIWLSPQRVFSSVASSRDFGTSEAIQTPPLPYTCCKSRTWTPALHERNAGLTSDAVTYAVTCHGAEIVRVHGFAVPTMVWTYLYTPQHAATAILTLSTTSWCTSGGLIDCKAPNAASPACFSTPDLIRTRRKIPCMSLASPVVRRPGAAQAPIAQPRRRARPSPQRPGTMGIGVREGSRKRSRSLSSITYTRKLTMTLTSPPQRVPSSISRPFRMKAGIHSGVVWTWRPNLRRVKATGRGPKLR